MTVYIDDFLFPAKVGRFDSRWSHLVADTHDELIDFAKGLGLNVGWIQARGTHREHFSVTESVRLKAIKNGADPINAQEELREIWNSKRETGVV